MFILVLRTIYLLCFSYNPAAPILAKFLRAFSGAPLWIHCAGCIVDWLQIVLVRY